MSGAIRSGLSELLALEGLFDPLWADASELSLRGPRARQATITALAVTISATLGMLGHMDMPWWAAISGFMSVQATRPGSVTRAALRVVGTVAGAGLALMVAPWIVHDHVAGSLFLFAISFFAILGCLVSPYAYAWLFCGITANLVILLSISEPTLTLHYAGYRLLEVATGTLTALLVVLLLAPDGDTPQAPLAPGWSDLLGARWPAVLHAARTGIAVMLLPWTWAFFNLPGLSQMAVTVAAVMAVPVLADHPMDQGRQIAGRAMQRVLGCLVGGAVGLLVLAASPNQFLPWVSLLGCGAWLGAFMQASMRCVGYVGTQATVVYMMTVVQGWGPPTSILPGIDRLVGIAGGITILFVVSLLFWPEEER